MSFQPVGKGVLEVTVDARAFGQQLLNTFYYRYNGSELGPVPGSSSIFMSNFIEDFRAIILPQMYAAYTVHRYWLRTIIGIVVSDPGPPNVYRKLYEPTLFDYVDGAGADVGAKALAVGDAYLPMANCARVLKKPNNPTLRYFNKNYNRWSPFTSAELDTDSADHDRWTAAFVTAFEGAMDNFVDEVMFSVDPDAGSGWSHCLFSVPYMVYLTPDTPGIVPRDAAVLSESTAVQPFVGMQNSRRYSPTGRYRGS